MSELNEQKEANKIVKLKKIATAKGKLQDIIIFIISATILLTSMYLSSKSTEGPYIHYPAFIFICCLFMIKTSSEKKRINALVELLEISERREE
jgi:hypothetical protein